MTEVTRAHRERAVDVFGWRDAIGTGNRVNRWIETGEAEGNVAGDTLPMVAAGLAAFEAELVARLSEELRAAKSNWEHIHQVNETLRAERDRAETNFAMACRDLAAKADPDFASQFVMRSEVEAAKAELAPEREGAAVGLLLAVCNWLHRRGHKSAATDLDYNWNDPDQPGDGSCLPLHKAVPAPSAGEAWVALAVAVIAAADTAVPLLDGFGIRPKEATAYREARAALPPPPAQEPAK
jgi:hypothetical protein